MSIDIRNLAKAYDGVAVIEDLSLRFASGKISVLLGPSGCGKTTTLRCIAGLEEPSAGEILIEDRHVFDAARGLNVPTEQRDIGMVFQSYAIWPHMTVFENVALPLRARKVPREEARVRVMDTLATVGLAPMAARSATALSGGQQQRVALARCLASHPKLILLDEPLSNLDAKLRVEMRAEIKDLQRRLGATMLFVTHDQEEALALGDEILLFDRGAVVQSGSPRDLYFHPRTRFAAEFLGKANLIPVHLDAVDGETAMRAHARPDHLLGTLRAPMPAMDNPCLMIRPEAWRVGTPDAHAVDATIEDSTFIGNRLIVRAATSLGTQTLSLDGFASLRAGQSVGLTIDPQRLHLIDVPGIVQPGGA